MSEPLGYPRLIEAAECSKNEPSSLRKIITLGRVRFEEIFTPVGFSSTGMKVPGRPEEGAGPPQAHYPGAS
jgi:hypothetical protein